MYESDILLGHIRYFLDSLQYILNLLPKLNGLLVRDMLADGVNAGHYMSH